jgi:hypothetical protein
MRHLGLFAAAAVALAGCGGSTVTGSSSTTSTMNVAMVDAPFASSGITVTAVNLGILKVEVVGSGASPTAFVTNTNPQVVNILTFTSVNAPLSFVGPIPPGTYSQVRFVLDTATTTISYTDANGLAHNNVALTIPSATTNGNGNNTSTDAGDGQGTAGVKVNVALTAVAGTSYGFVIDFNALHSIVLTGNGQFTMKPVLVATAQAISGAIAGSVKNQAGAAVSGAEVDAVQGGTTVNSSVTASDGTFTINALPAGSYTLVVQNSYTVAGSTTGSTATGFDAAVGASLTVSGSFNVTAGQTTQAGAITD